jgi:hypothetical protein
MHRDYQREPTAQHMAQLIETLRFTDASRRAKALRKLLRLECDTWIDATMKHDDGTPSKQVKLYIVAQSETFLLLIGERGEYLVAARGLAWVTEPSDTLITTIDSGLRLMETLEAAVEATKPHKATRMDLVAAVMEWQAKESKR